LKKIVHKWKRRSQTLSTRFDYWRDKHKPRIDGLMLVKIWVEMDYAGLWGSVKVGGSLSLSLFSSFPLLSAIALIFFNYFL
jgi:hypothetical protein